MMQTLLILFLAANALTLAGCSQRSAMGWSLRVTASQTSVSSAAANPVTRIAGGSQVPSGIPVAEVKLSITQLERLDLGFSSLDLCVGQWHVRALMWNVPTI